MKLQADYNCYLTEATEIALTERNFYDVVAIMSSEDAKNWKQINAEEYKNYQAQINAINFEPSFEYLQEFQTASIMTASKINEIELTNKQSLEVKSLFPNWETGLSVEKGQKYQYNDLLYICLQSHTTQADWTPDTAVSMWAVISEHEGTKEDPIPYVQMMILEKGKFYTQYDVLYECIQSTNNGYPNDLRDMASIVTPVTEETIEPSNNEKGTIDNPITYDKNSPVFNGKYYIEDGVKYLCTRDSGNALYNTCASLVGIYFKLA